jgi:uncharacterized membrane protein YgaE (UPF0421/DUF939 family)
MTLSCRQKVEYGRRSSENDILNDKCQDLNENLASKEKLIKLLGEKNKSLYYENQQQHHNP